VDVFLPKGTRDFLPSQLQHRLAVIDTIRRVFQLHGFAPLDTPAFERLETLTGRYGEDEKLIFRILERGAGGQRGETDLALRYDLTVPLARVVAMHPELKLPFRRSHIAPVWRADRPAKGRFREFLQCDCDIVGSAEATADSECLAVAAAALEAVGLSAFEARLNDRRILRGIAQVAGAPDREAELLVAIDKLDKIGHSGVDAELAERGVGPDARQAIWALLDVPASEGDEAVLDHLLGLLAGYPDAQAGVERVRQVRDLALAYGLRPDQLRVDPTLARGLGYYTGPVFEFSALGGGIGSIAGGGRYDDLIGFFSGRVVPAVGVSLGLERILTLLESDEAGLPTVDVLVTVLDEARRPACLDAARRLRAGGVRTELWLGVGQLGKQLKHAAALQARFAVLIGGNEARDGVWLIRDLRDGTQQALPPEAAIAHLRRASAG
jgi:histidyl-tRNA synthetase